MDAALVKQIVDEILESLEPLETHSAAILQFLKAKGIATDEELAPFLEQAGNASSVRWRAVRVRTAALISNAMKAPEQDAATPGGKERSSEEAIPEQSSSEPPSPSRLIPRKLMKRIRKQIRRLDNRRGAEPALSTEKKNGEPGESDSPPAQASIPDKANQSQAASTPTQEGTKAEETKSKIASEHLKSSTPEAA